jgi:glutathione S-transferase
MTMMNLGVEFEVRIEVIIGSNKKAQIYFQSKVLNMAAGEHKSEDYLKINPKGTVPAVSDDDFVMNESRAIMCYLVNAKSPNNYLYPSDDPKARFIIDHRLYYDASTFMPACSAALVRS